MKFCPMCGKPIEPSDKICGQCGARLFTDERAPDSQPPQEAPQQRAPQQETAQHWQANRPSQDPYDGRGASGGQRAAEVVSGYDRPKQGKSAAPIIIGALAAVVVILAAVLGVMALRGRGGDDAAAATPAPEETLTPEEEEAPITDVPYYVTGVSDRLGVRSAAGSGSSVVGWLENSDKVLILSDDGDTWKVRASDGELAGYVDRHYLTVDAGSVTAPSTMYITGAASSLAVTETQDSNWEIGSVSNGDEVTVLAKTSGGSWYIYSEALHAYGYVSRDHLSAERPADPTPTPEPTPTPSSGTGTALIFGSGTAPSSYTVYYASVQSGYLALRNAKAFDASNELGKIQNGEPVYVMTTPGETYWYVYAPTLGMYGYTNSNYLSLSGGYTAPSTYYWTVSVKTGYLALRTAKAYDSRNEIGELYTGDQVEVLDSSDGTYWYVYSPKLGMYGYVNKNYLY